MKQLKLAMQRIAIIALSAALVIGLTEIYARSSAPRQNNQGERRELRHRPPELQLSAFPKFIRQCAVFAALALVGRKVLRLRL